MIDLPSSIAASGDDSRMGEIPDVGAGAPGDRPVELKPEFQPSSRRRSPPSS